MAIGVYKSKVSIPEIGINVASSNTKSNSLQSISNSYAQTSNLFFQAAGDEAKKVATEFGMSVPIEKVMGINGDTGMPEAYSLPENYGTIAMDAFKRVIDQRFFEAIENDYRAKAKELYTKYSLDVAGFENAFLGYTAEVVDVAKGKFKEFARELGINQTKGYVANIRSNIYQESLRKAKELDQKQNVDFIDIMLNGAFNFQNQVNQFGVPRGSDFGDYPDSFIQDSINGFRASKQALIDSGTTTEGEVLGTIRDGVNVFLQGRLNTILNDEFFKNSRVNSDIFINSVKLRRTHRDLPKEANEFIRSFLSINPSQQMVKDMVTIYKGDQTLFESHRQTLAEDAANKKKESDEALKLQQKINSAISVSDFIDLNNTTEQNFLNRDFIPYGDLYNFEVNSKAKHESNQLINISDPNRGYEGDNGILNSIDKVVGRVLNQGYTNIIKKIANTIPTDTSSETLKDIKAFIMSSYSGSVKPNEVDENLLGIPAATELKNLLTHYPIPENKVEGFRKENEFEILDRILEKRIAQEKIDAQLQKEDREIFQANQLRINRNVFYDRFDNQSFNILDELKTTGDFNEESYNKVLNDLNSQTTVRAEFGGKPILSVDKKNELEKKFKSDVAAQLIANELINFIIESEGTAKGLGKEDVKQISDYFDSGSKDIPIPEPLRVKLSQLEREFNFNVVDEKRMFQSILANYNEYYDKKEAFKNEIRFYNSLTTGDRTNVDGNLVDNAIRKRHQIGDLPFDPFDHYTSQDRKFDLPLLEMIANDNVGDELVKVVKTFASDPSNSAFENKNMNFFINFLRTLKQFPTGNGNQTIDIVPTKFTNDPEIARLFTILDMTARDVNIDISSIKSNIDLVNRNIGLYKTWLDENKDDFRNDSLEDEINKQLGTKGLSRFNSANFFEMIDNELPVAVALGTVRDKESLGVFLNKRYGERYIQSSEVLENFNDPSGTNRTNKALEITIPNKEVRDATKDSIILEVAMPFWKDHFARFVPSKIEQGFALKFGDKLYPSKKDYDPDNIISIIISPKHKTDNDPIDVISTLADGFEYADRGMPLPREELYGMFFKSKGMSNHMPMGGLMKKNQLDPLTEHHYQTIADGNFVQRNNLTSTVYASTLGFEVNGIEAHFLLPTVWDGRIMPINTEEEISALVQRIESTGKSVFDYPSFSTPLEAQQYYEDVKLKWANIGTDADAASYLLEVNSFDSTDIVTVNPFDIAAKFNRLKNIELNNKLIKDEMREMNKLISDYRHTKVYNMPYKFRKPNELSLEKSRELVEQIQIETIDKRNIRKMNIVAQLKSNVQPVKDNLQDFFINLYSSHYVDLDGLPGINQMGVPESGELSNETIEAMRLIMSNQ